ncbi:MAG: hypothetical protein JRH20_27175 [Deltaproteobacteria bacterium]|nr:hypothetical protein [Deltaproteobacteria bacterium]
MMHKTFMALLFVFFVACGGNDGEPGESCTGTIEGASECESGICLAIECSGETLHVCAGSPCTDACSGEMVCVQTLGGEGYCLPPNTCSR